MYGVIKSARVQKKEASSEELAEPEKKEHAAPSEEKRSSRLERLAERQNHHENHENHETHGLEPEKAQAEPGGGEAAEALPADEPQAPIGNFDDPESLRDRAQARRDRHAGQSCTPRNRAAR